jgi:hypothetical protein
MTARYKMKWHEGKLKYLHRYLWEQEHGPIPEGMTIDHIDGDKKNNSMSNLRMVSQSDNLKNMRTRTHKVPGVRKAAGRSNYQVRIQSKGTKHYIGVFDDWFEAVCARMSANNKYGFHENHGRR